MTLDDDIASDIVEIEGRSYTFAELTGIDNTNLNHEFTVQASRYAYIAALTAKAEAAYNATKTARETAYAEIELAYREELAKSEVKVTEGIVKSYVTIDEVYNAALRKENDALRNWKTLKALEAGVRERGSMLISIGAQFRFEAEMTNLHINEARQRVRDSRSGS